ncbi:MAG TPA: type II toxin-antitoxin system HicA family toxin [Euryarchaeota archaeon]|nr:YcfA-like protein [archaeon BMS3Abin16]GBE56506.1 YcfA-like protein [archaeon BMS3Bbin16]HDH28149.1 type II toxin-antitoxin system HicA family toxin [Euryarchaeota archaeon]HDY73699.1 type II toxin-antitoxin system HicA family toxin [Euryarchaeota archaeon]
MTKLILVKAKKMEKLLFKLGFKKIRQKGSHVFYKHPDGRYTTVPHHKSMVLARPLIREILKEIEIGLEEYIDLLKKV